MTAADVIAGRANWSIECSPWEEWVKTIPNDSIDLLFCSPPYEDCRQYGELRFDKRGEAWVSWMFDFVKAFAPKVKGLISIVCDGKTKQYRYSCTPQLLMADLHRAGFNFRKTPIFKRVGIPGSGGPDWFRSDYEHILCITRKGKLPWSDNTADGHPPKWALGGEMSYRITDGTRVNQWGKCGTEAGVNGSAQRTRDGGRQKASRPSHVMQSKRKNFGHNPDGSVNGAHDRNICAIANPGNVFEQPTYTCEEVSAILGIPIQAEYTAAELAAILGEGDVHNCKVGGGLMGHDLAHENEAPFPLELAERYVRSFCPPGGIVCDPFSGSGTTLHASIKHGRRGIACDIRQDQVEITTKRITEVQGLFDAVVHDTQVAPAQPEQADRPEPIRDSQTEEGSLLDDRGLLSQLWD